MTITRKDARQLLTESVKELASRNPINKISVTEIARNCSLSTSAFYYYFSDKYELVSYVINSEIDEQVKNGCMPIQEFLAHLLEMMESEQQFYSNILENTLVDYPNHSFFHEMLDTHIKNMIVTNCMSIVPEDGMDLTLQVYLSGITGLMCSHVLNHRMSQRELLNAFVAAIPDSLKPYINTKKRLLS